MHPLGSPYSILKGEWQAWHERLPARILIRRAGATCRERALDRALEPPRRWRAVRLNPSDGVGPALEANLRGGRSGMPEVSRAPAAHRCHRRPGCRALDPAEPRHAHQRSDGSACARPDRSIRARADRALRRSRCCESRRRGRRPTLQRSLWSVHCAASEHSAGSGTPAREPITLSLPPTRASSTIAYALSPPTDAVRGPIWLSR
jgi:hypothetical protein